MNKDIILEYVRLLEDYSINSNIVFTNEQQYIINMVNDKALKDVEFREFLDELINHDNKSLLIENYFKNIEEKNNGFELEAISNAFGIDISKIQHKYLENCKEIFCFYISSIDENIVLENKKNGVSLVEQLKQIQVQNNEYQTDDNKKNVQNILEDKRYKENCELKMIPINEINAHLNKVKNLVLEDYVKLNFMLKNSMSLGIVSINLENMIGLDKNGKIYEVYNNKGEYKISEPNTVSYNESNINTSDRVNVEYSNSQKINVLVNNYEDIPNEKVVFSEDNIIKFYDLPEEIQDKIKIFYENPFLLNDLTEEERNLWKEYVNGYIRILEEEGEIKNNKNDAPKVKRYIKDENEGYINLSSLALIISFVILTMLVVISVCS